MEESQELSSIIRDYKQKSKKGVREMGNIFLILATAFMGFCAWVKVA